MGHPDEFISAFIAALRCPQDLLDAMLALRAQAIPREKMSGLMPLVQGGSAVDLAVDPTGFHAGPRGELFRNLLAFARGAAQCAQVYSEIRESAASGKIDAQQAARLLDGNESDQKRMMGAMSSVGSPRADAYEELTAYA